MTSPSPEPPRRPVSTRSHQVHRFTGRLGEVLDQVGTETLWALSPEELSESLREAYAAEARLARLKLALLAQADRSDVATHDAQPHMVAWLREHARLAPPDGRRQVKLARALEQHPLTAEALAAGSFPVASAAVVVEAVDALPVEVDPVLREQAETHLAGEAHVHDTQALRRLAAHLEEVIDPEGADQRLAEQLARAEAKAAREAFFRLRHNEQTATTEGAFRIPLMSGVKLQRMLESILNPNRPDPIAEKDPETGAKLGAEERRGHAFIELIDRIPTGKLPKLGGSDPTVVVMMDLATLMGGLRAAHLDTGHQISPGLARQLAAQAGIIPAVMGGDGEVLDLGRKRRLHPKKLRLAMLIQQDGTCAVQHCTRPGIGSDAHHLIAWSEGGPTNVADGALLCPRHHTLADHPDYIVTRLRPGRIRINKRC
ncbi:hypothetical protein JCM18899A_36140 [Nocardioides sp. AN3]